ncbi:flagellar hook-associated protein FlgK [Pseudorhodoferax sp. Leaf267]|uniref:flagellar hook-associated protein FlgK n=1 Tax=Pseudorhodoferax sp. Leaf267 TaxID=1736316 RepID=UPI0006F42834|nr:flagellar hook-associated protein FlgK [Pseudorhodoferax sp. Leaf267]KQP13746.1 flagellar biosynthesis protein FlgK [Pseudorhodoferax sp. Leaf267]
MSNILNVGTRALLANQVALQTAGHNISNANTVGYSRQVAQLATVEGQFSGSGFIGKGVDVVAIERVFDAYLTRQATLSKSVAAQDVARAQKLLQLEDVFGTGKTGLGASVNEMLNAFTDVVSSPTDLTARTVVLTRASETATRFNDAATQLSNLQSGLTEELQNSVDAVNTLARGIANVNAEIQKAQGSGQSPNDLLDKRDKLVSDLNQYVQTTSLDNNDGTISVFAAQSQPLVQGTRAAQLAIQPNPLDPTRSQLNITNGHAVAALREDMLGGGSISGLMRFQNEDLVEAANLLGRMAVSITTVVNAQHQLGVDLDGKPGGNLFSAIAMPGGVAAANNTGTASVGVRVASPATAPTLQASDYRVVFTSPTTFTVERLSDNSFPAVDAGPPPTVDGLAIDVTGTAATGDMFLLRPFSNAAAGINTMFASPRALAVASPVQAAMGTTNTGGLTVASLRASAVPVPANVTITFVTSTSYTRSDDPTATPIAYSPGDTITHSGATPPDWMLKLNGAAQPGDTVTVGPINPAFAPLDAGNAQALMELRDMKLFDQAPMSDGYASLISQIGVRAQSAQYGAEVSQSIADSLEAQRSGVSGVNLDEEAAKLIQYQQAYQASAKMIQVAQSIFDSLIATITA